MAKASPENEISYGHPFISWRATVAGLFVAFLIYGIALALGVGIGGVTLPNPVDRPITASVAVGLWIVLASAVALFCGAYFAARVSRYNTARVGSAEGLVIASLFFVSMMVQTQITMGWMSRGFGNAFSAINAGVGSLADNPQIQDLIQSATANLNLRSPPDRVIAGLVNRLIRGDEAGARDFLAFQANLGSADAQTRINQIRDQFKELVTQTARFAAQTASAAAWSLFLTMVLGAAASIGGGAVGSRINSKQPLARTERMGMGELNMQPV